MLRSTTNGGAVLLSALALAAGCAAMHTRVEERQVARHPPQARQELLSEQQKIDVARSNVTTARVALDDSQRFRRLARDEVAGAEARLRAASGSRQAYDRAQRDLIASRAKLAYAVEAERMRQARVGEAQASLRLASANVELAKYRALQQHGIAPTVDRGRLVDEQRRAQNDLATARLQVAQLGGAVDGARRTWRRQQQQASAAAPATPRM